MVVVPGPLKGPIEIARNPTEDGNIAIASKVRIFPAWVVGGGGGPLELWVAAPDPLTWGDRNYADAIRSSRKLKTAQSRLDSEYFWAAHR